MTVPRNECARYHDERSVLNPYKYLLLVSVLVAAAGGLSACGGSSSDGVSLQGFDVTGEWTGNLSQHNRQALVPITIVLSGGQALNGTIEVSGHTCIDDGNVTGTATQVASNTQGDNPLTPGIRENANQGTVKLSFEKDAASGGITAVAFTLGSQGSGYTSVPTVTFAAPLDAGGERAEGIAQVGGVTSGDGGALHSTVTVDTGGSGYTSVPTVTIADAPAGGTTATAVAHIGGTRRVTGIAAGGDGGEGYSSVPTVTFSAPETTGGVTATGVAVLGEPGRIISLTCATTGVNYTQATTTITINDPDVSDGVTATANPIINNAGAIIGAVVTNPGSGYNIRPGVTVTSTIANATGAVCTVEAGDFESDDAGQVVAINITNPGSGYLLDPSITITGGGGSGANYAPTLTTAANEGQVVHIDLIEHGKGYVEAPIVTISGGGGTGARATVTLAGGAASGGEVTGVIITNPGSGYLASDPPVVSFSGGGGTGAMGFGTVGTTGLSPGGLMEFHLSGTSDQLRGHYSGIWSNSNDSCRVNTTGEISLNRS